MLLDVSLVLTNKQARDGPMVPWHPMASFRRALSEWAVGQLSKGPKFSDVADVAAVGCGEGRGHSQAA